MSLLAFPDNRLIWVKVKCFNLIAKELGPELLRQGIWVPKSRFYQFLQDYKDVLQHAEITLGHKPKKIVDLANNGNLEGNLKLTVHDISQ